MKPEDHYAWYMKDIWSVLVPSFYLTPSSYLPPLYILNFIYLFFLVVLNGMWNLSSLTRDGTHTLYTGSVTTDPPEKSLLFIISIFSSKNYSYF